MRARKSITCAVVAAIVLTLAACDPGKASQAGHKNDSKGNSHSKVKIVTGDDRKGKRLSKPQSLGRSCGYNHRNDTAPQKGHPSHIVKCKFNSNTNLWEWM